MRLVIHPISKQTNNLMDLDKEGRLRTTWGRADLPPVLC